METDVILSSGFNTDGHTVIWNNNREEVTIKGKRELGRPLKVANSQYRHLQHLMEQGDVDIELMHALDLGIRIMYFFRHKKYPPLTVNADNVYGEKHG